MGKTIIAIGDVHGSAYWKTVIEENPNCRYVFLGDYLDPYTMVGRDFLKENLKTIISLKEEHPDDVVLLLGNHDIHYVNLDLPRCSRFDYSLMDEASQIFNDNSHLFAYAYREDKYLFTHAGIAKQWFMDDFKGDPNGDIVEQLNHPTDEQLPSIYRAGRYRGGDGAVGGILWADVHELAEPLPLPGITQVVGHNRVEDIREQTYENGARIIFCDSLFNKHYLKLE